MLSQEFTFRKDIKKTFFPHIYENDDLLEDKNLNPLKLISPKTKLASNKSKVQIDFKLLTRSFEVDVFLYLNGQKTDMYYSIPSGRYSFTVFLERGTNNVKIYYVVNERKSPSVNKTFMTK
jgi:hypothetical protein